MIFDKPITRRESLKRLMKISGCLSLTGVAAGASGLAGDHPAAAAPAGFMVEAVGETEGYDVRQLTRNTFQAAGGISKFISKGDVVVIKPNISWARRPEMAASTNPHVLQAVIELCQEAGAKKVRIADNSIHDARRCFALTGAGMVANKTGADLIYPRSSLMRRMKLQGNRLDTWPVFVPLVEADKVINLPVAKHHSLSTLTLGMKNWIGAVGGRRNKLHQDIHMTIVDLAQFFNPTLTLIDGIRIMTRNGPSGGSTTDVAVKNTLILSNDPVAADARAALLFGRRPERIGFIKLGNKWGLGTYNLEQLTRHKVIL
ncbi:hypothetical protein D1AOALGA4SA_563 [Olavius algarvensis Delta 1 endosymbiont]|nr:hypothetical protein D1AOALGA4SA_563 [Olavius algarvensis Delta 1 endosymbiont]